VRSPSLCRFQMAQFDVVPSTMMLHHLPRKARQELAGEMRRVLKPGGRVLAVDFGGTAQERKSFSITFITVMAMSN
jgi:ubiquinone/menaquinone biosynthesis C-methylase UbiE